MISPRLCTHQNIKEDMKSPLDLTAIAPRKWSTKFFGKLGRASGRKSDFLFGTRKPTASTAGTKPGVLAIFLNLVFKMDQSGIRENKLKLPA
jgi:hypothetical protein